MGPLRVSGLETSSKVKEKDDNRVVPAWDLARGAKAHFGILHKMKFRDF